MEWRLAEVTDPGSEIFDSESNQDNEQTQDDNEQDKNNSASENSDESSKSDQTNEDDGSEDFYIKSGKKLSDYIKDMTANGLSNETAQGYLFEALEEYIYEEINNDFCERITFRNINIWDEKKEKWLFSFGRS